MNVCPVYKIIGGQRFSSNVYMGGIGIAWTAITQGIDKAKKFSSLCSSCGTCLEVCPMDIPIPKLVHRVKELAEPKPILERIALKGVSDRKILEAGSNFARLFFPNRIEKLPGPFSLFTNHRTLEFSKDTSFPLWAKKKGLMDEKKGDLTLYVGCMINYLYPKIAKDAIDVLTHFKIKAQVIHELCCGLPAKILGEEDLFRKLAMYNISCLDKTKPVLFLCATCMGAFEGYKELKRDLPPLFDLSLLLLEILKESPFPGRFKAKVAYHHPCHEVHYLGMKDAPLKLLKKIEGVELIERESVCCGGAGLYAFKYPPISREILEETLDWLKRKNIEVLVTSCPSCIMQLKGGVLKKALDVRVLHIATFLKESIYAKKNKDKGV